MRIYKKYKNQKDDGRVKITRDQYPEVLANYEMLKSSRKVAKIYGVSKTIILGILNPEIREKMNKRRVDNYKANPTPTKEHTRRQQKYRAKKRDWGFLWRKKSYEYITIIKKAVTN